MSKLWPKIGVALAVIAGAQAEQALGAGFYVQEQGAAGVGRAQAGNVVAADDASTIYFNPAGLSELEGVQTAGGIDLIIPDAQLVDQGTRNRSVGAFLGNPLSGGFSANGGRDSGNPGSATPIPDFFISAHIPDSDVTVGLGVTTPFGFASKFKSDWFGRYDSIDSYLETIDIAPTIAWKPNDWLSIGIGLDEQYAYVKLRSALPDALAVGGPSPATDGRLTLTGHTWTTGFNLGILIKPMPGTKLGFAYRYGLSHKIDGSITFSGLGGLLAAVNGQFPGAAALDLPDIFEFGASQQITPELTLMGEVDYYTWSNFKSIDIRLTGGPIDRILTAENYQDTVSVALGAEYQLTDRLKLRGGIKWDQTPTVDAFRDSRVPDGDRFWIAGGVHYALTEQLGIDASYAHIFLTDSNVNVARDFYTTAGLPIATTSQVKAQSQVGIDILTLGFSYRF